MPMNSMKDKYIIFTASRPYQSYPKCLLCSYFPSPTFITRSDVLTLPSESKFSGQTTTTKHVPMRLNFELGETLLSKSCFSLNNEETLNCPEGRL